MNELLTRGIGHTEFKDSPVGRIPKSWEISGIYDVCDEIFLGLTSKVDYTEHSGVPLIRATDISNGILSFQNVRTISKSQHEALTKYRKGKKGDVLVSKSGSLGVCALVDTEKEFSIYESIIVIQPKQNILESSFLLWIMRSTNTQHRLLGDTVGSTVGHLNLGDFRRLRIAKPSLKEQIKISLTLSNLEEKIHKSVKKRKILESLKKSLMQDLLTGRVRVQVN